jgi:plastocyanin
MSDSTNAPAAPAAPAAKPAAEASSKEVCITDGKFTPANLSIKVGDCVCWKNDDVDYHTISFTAPPKPKAKEFDATKLGVGGDSSLPPAPALHSAVEAGCDSISPNDTWEKTFATAGTFPYHCDLNTKMKGVVTVTA